MSDCLLPTTTSCPVSESTNHILIVTAGTQNGRDLIKTTARECNTAKNYVEYTEGVQVNQIYVLVPDMQYQEYCSQNPEFEQAQGDDNTSDIWDNFSEKMEETITKSLEHISKVVIRKIMEGKEDSENNDRIDNCIKDIKKQSNPEHSNYYVDITHGTSPITSSIIMMATWFDWKVYSSDGEAIRELIFPPVERTITQPFEEEKVLEEIVGMQKHLKEINDNDKKRWNLNLSLKNITDLLEEKQEIIRDNIHLEEQIKFLLKLASSNNTSKNNQKVISIIRGYLVNQLKIEGVDDLLSGIRINDEIVERMYKFQTKFSSTSDAGEINEVRHNEVKRGSRYITRRPGWSEDEWIKANLKYTNSRYYVLCKILNEFSFDEDKSQLVESIWNIYDMVGIYPIRSLKDRMEMLQSKDEVEFEFSSAEGVTSSLLTEEGLDNIKFLDSILDNCLNMERKNNEGKMKKMEIKKGRDEPSINKKLTERRLLNIIYHLEGQEGVGKVPAILQLLHPEYKGRTGKKEGGSVSSRASTLLSDLNGVYINTDFIKPISLTPNNNGDRKQRQDNNKAKKEKDGRVRYYKLTDEGRMIANLLSN